MPNEFIEHSAGGLVYRRHHGQVELCMIKDSYGRWTFPKGHIENNERLEETAVREICEETSIPSKSLHLKRELGEINYWFISPFTRDGGSQTEPVKIHKYVTYFLFEVPFDTELVAQPGEVEETTWVPLEKIDEHNEYEDNTPIIRQAKYYLL